MTITCARESDLSPEDYIAVLGATDLGDRRPLGNRDRIAEMLAGANFVVVARDAAGQPVGLARCLTDFAWVCYCTELAVCESHQGQGIGKQILKTCFDLLGPRIGLVLIGDPDAIPFYEHIGMERHAGFFHTRTDAE